MLDKEEKYETKYIPHVMNLTKADSLIHRMRQKNHLRVGTRRYMAPEILDNTLKLDSFESFKVACI